MTYRTDAWRIFKAVVTSVTQPQSPEDFFLSLGGLGFLSVLLFMLATVCLIVVSVVPATLILGPTSWIARMSMWGAWVLLWIACASFAVFAFAFAVHQIFWPDKTEKYFQLFLKKWQEDYREQMKQISLFGEHCGEDWKMEQKRLFVRLFHHARGHFYEFLWHLANKTENWDRRRVIAQNICDELGTLHVGDAAHERLFGEFAATFGIELNDSETRDAYLPFLREFNDGHLAWISAHTEEEIWAMFSAYELLDNVDYAYLLPLAQRIGTNGTALHFFTVHLGGRHHEETAKQLLDIWKKNPEKVKEAFAFVASHQLKMWQGISAVVFAAP